MQNLNGLVYFLWFIVGSFGLLIALVIFGNILTTIDEVKAKLYLAGKYDENRRRGR